MIRGEPQPSVQSKRSAEPLDDGGVGHAAALTHGLQPVPPAALFQRIDQSGHDASATGAQWVTDRDGTAVDVGLAQVGSDPLYMLTGVIPATEKVLARAGLTLADIDLFEVNEAFAPVVLSWAKELSGAHASDLLAKTNVNGGAIAIGHPLGASGARIMTTLVNALQQRDGRYALQTMCEGGGMANATIIERL